MDKQLNPDFSSIVDLNKSYLLLNPIERLSKLFSEVDRSEILVTSSFGVTSGILLSMISKVAPGHPIHFIDTTFCFKETIDYKSTLISLLDLNIINVLPDVADNNIARKEKLWDSDSDKCCHLNKIKPFDPHKLGKRFWVSGLLMNQSPFRANLEIFEKRDTIIKMHPNVDYSSQQFDMYLVDNGIPAHPLRLQGYDSVGCTHCTKKGKGRTGRWEGKDKKECGLHT